jgi:hypothetical protein
LVTAMHAFAEVPPVRLTGFNNSFHHTLYK